MTESSKSAVLRKMDKGDKSGSLARVQDVFYAEFLARESSKVSESGIKVTKVTKRVKNATRYSIRVEFLTILVPGRIPA